MAAQPQLRDIFQYLQHTAPSASTPYRFSGGAGNDAWLNNSSDWAFNVRNEGGDNAQRIEEWSIRPGSRLEALNNQYGLNAQVVRENDQWWNRMDTSRLPRTRFGSVEDVVPVDERTRLRNSGMVYDDPVYGRITHRSNLARPNAWVGPLLMAAVGAGMGSLVGAAGGAGAASNFRTGMGAVNALRGGFSGRFNPLQLAQLVSGLGGINVPGLQQVSSLMNSPYARVAQMLGPMLARGRGRPGG